MLGYPNPLNLTKFADVVHHSIEGGFVVVVVVAVVVVVCLVG